MGLAVRRERETTLHDVFVEDVVPEIPGLRYAGQIFTGLWRKVSSALMNIRDETDLADGRDILGRQ